MAASSTPIPVDVSAVPAVGTEECSTNDDAVAADGSRTDEQSTLQASAAAQSGGADITEGEDQESKACRRLEEGKCATCGQQLFVVKPNGRPRGWLKSVFKKGTTSRRDHNEASADSVGAQQRGKPLTMEGRVERGQCLICLDRQQQDRSNADDEVARDHSSTSSSLAGMTQHLHLENNIPLTTANQQAGTTAVYSGQYNEYGERHGEGEMTWSNGDRYKGNFFNGVRHGEGSLFFHQGGEYVGEWECNWMHGDGTRRFPNGDVYVGRYVDGKRQGEGRFFFGNGDLYTGAWQNDSMTGFGRYYYSSGQRFEGTFLQGKRHGPGKLQRTDGSLEVFRYIDDKRCGTGVRWSPDRKRAWKLSDGARRGNAGRGKSISIAEAVSIGYDIEQAQHEAALT